MDSLAFVAGMAIVLVALHAVVAAYLYRAALSGDRGTGDRKDASERRATYPTDRWLAGTDGPEGSDGAAASSGAEETVPCPTCGSANDPGYRFCRNCVTDLSGSQRTPVSDGAGRLGS